MYNYAKCNFYCIVKIRPVINCDMSDVRSVLRILACTDKFTHFHFKYYLKQSWETNFFSWPRWFPSLGSQEQCRPFRQGYSSSQSQPPAVQEECFWPQDATPSDETTAGKTSLHLLFNLECGSVCSDIHLRVCMWACASVHLNDILKVPCNISFHCVSPQLQNQEALRFQLKRAEQEIGVKLAEAMRRLEDPVQRQRTLVEEDRHKYLGLEEHVLKQLR